MAKKDIAHDDTDKILKALEERVAREYKQAEEEVEEKLNDYLARFKKKDALKRKALAHGLITQQEYNQWRIGQIMMGQRWEEMRATLAADYSNANQIARSIAYGYMPDVYAINANYATYLVERGAMIDTSYTLYSRETVEHLFKNEVFYPKPGKKLTARINMGLDQEWNKQQVQSVMIQGILQGESIGQISTRLATTVGDKNRKATIRNVRTMTTAVESAGRVASYERAEAMGINLEQEWLATLDNRTRHAHRELDGQRVPVGKPFQVDGWDIEYPGDPSAPAYLVYNCRCTLIAAVKGYAKDASDLSIRNDKKLGNMTYDEWKASKESVSQSITHQDEVEQIMKKIYNAEYKQYAGL